MNVNDFNIRQTGERQKHGFDYEKKIISRFNLTKYKDYTCEYDAFGIYKSFVINYSIKCIKYGSAIELGDYRRNKNKKDDFMVFGKIKKTT